MNTSKPAPVPGAEFYTVEDKTTGNKITYLVIGNESRMWDSFNHEWKPCHTSAGMLRRAIPTTESETARIY